MKQKFQQFIISNAGIISLVILTTILFVVAVSWLGYDMRAFFDAPIGGPSQDDVWVERWALYQTSDNLLHHPIKLGYSTVAYGEYDDPLGPLLAPYSIAISTLPFYILSGENIDFTFNVAYFLGYLLTACIAYLLVRHLLQGPVFIAILAALMLTFCEYRFLRWAHLSLVSTQYLLLMLYSLHCYLDSQRVKWLILCGLAWSFSLMQGYYGMMGLVVSGIILLFGIIRHPSLLSKQLIIHLVLAAVVALVVIYPFIAFRLDNPSFQAGHSMEQIIDHSATPQSWFSSHSAIYMNLVPFEGETTIFIGFIPLLLSIAAWFQRNYSSGGSLTERLFSRREVVILYTIIGLVGYLLTLGPIIHIGDQAIMPSPYMLLMQLPGFSDMRFLGRYIFIAVIATSVLSAYALHVLHERLPRLQFSLVFILVLIPLILELIPFNGDYSRSLSDAYRLPSEHRLFQVMRHDKDTPLNQWLRDQPANTLSVHIPFGIPETFQYYADIPANGQPIVNGVGLTHVPGWMLSDDWNNFPTDYLMDALKTRDTSYVIVHYDLMTEDERTAFDNHWDDYWATSAVAVERIEEFDQAAVYRVTWP